MIKKDLIKEIEAIDKKEANNMICEIDNVGRTAIKSKLGSIDLNEARYWSEKAFDTINFKRKSELGSMLEKLRRPQKS